MASPPADGLLLDQKPVKVASTSETEIRDEPNGTKVNGHTSPKPDHLESKSEDTPNPKEVQSESRKSTDSSLTNNLNEGAFASNQSVSTGDDPKPVDKTDMPEADGKDSASAEESKEVKPPVDADIDVAPEEKAAAASEPKPSTAEASAPAAPSDEGPPSDAKSSEPTEAPKSAPTPTAEKDDVEMSDAPAQVDPASSADQLESTQDTSMSDIPPITPAEESNIQASIAVSSQATAPSADDSSIKVSRARDDDGEDEPLAKRTKVEVTADEVQVKTSRDTQPMDVDGQGSESNGQPKSLADQSLDHQALSVFQNRELRKLLALVKKTRAGSHFKQSVEIGWPALWPDYKAKIDNPMDISTMEKKLRAEGGLGPYAHMREFKDDIELIHINSATFNGSTHDITAAAKSLRDDLLGRLAKTPAAEPPKQEKKESIKHHPTRHTEPRAAPAQPPAAATPRRPSKPAAPTAVEKPVESPAFAIPPNNNGVPLIRRDSTKVDDRPKRPVNPPKNKDITYEPKKKRKVAPEIKFCEEILTELKKAKYNEISNAFMFPVDPVAMNIPHYHKVVKKPMDLQSMTHKLKDGEYSSAKEFEKDFNLIISNCRAFNGEGSPYTQSAMKLESIFKQEWAKKEEWVAKHTPSTTANVAAATSPTAKDESEEEEDAEVEAEPDPASLTSPLLEGLIVRLKEEQDKLDAQTTSAKPDVNALALGETMTAMLRKQIVEERIRLANQAEQTKPPKKAPKKKGGAGGGKKAAGNGGQTATAKKSGGKKAAPKIRKLSAAEKDIVVNGIGDLEGNQLEKAIDIIKKDTGQGENDSGELELDIESLSDEALNKLYDIITKAFPSMRVEKEKTVQAAPASAHKAKSASKAKKNKPMSKTEQERRIQQLNELRAQAARQGSGSQEPIDSIEGNGGSILSDPAPMHESEDEESSEEE